MLCIILILVALLTAYYYWIYRPWNFWKRRGIIHMEQSLTAYWKYFTKPMDATKFFDDLYKKAKDNNAKYVGAFRNFEPLVCIADVELIKKITVKDFDHFFDHMQFIDEKMDPLLGKIIFSLRGKEWREMRNTLTPAFTSSKMKAMFPLINECAEHLTEFFLGEFASHGDTLSLEMKDVFTRFANDVIATATFGYKCDSLKERDNTFYTKAKEACDFSALAGFKYIALSLFPALSKIISFRLISEETSGYFRNLITDSIEYRKKNGIVRPDMIHLLMQARKGELKNDEETNEAALNRRKDLTDDDITAQALTFFIAGFDTTSTLMCYIAYELSVNPDIQARLKEEMDSVLEENGTSKISYDVLMKMKYLDMIVSETLRKWPPAIIGDRLCVKPYVLEPSKPGEPSVTLEPGMGIWFPNFSIQRDEEYFPNPERFDPERFSAENKKNINPYAYGPFGHGPRNCIGNRFVLMEAKILFFHLLSKFEIVVIEKTSIPIKLDPKLWNLTVEGGMWLGFRKREENKSA